MFHLLFHEIQSNVSLFFGHAGSSEGKTKLPIILGTWIHSQTLFSTSWHWISTQPAIVLCLCSVETQIPGRLSRTPPPPFRRKSLLGLRILRLPLISLMFHNTHIFHSVLKNKANSPQHLRPITYFLPFFFL